MGYDRKPDFITIHHTLHDLETLRPPDNPAAAKVVRRLLAERAHWLRELVDRGYVRPESWRPRQAALVAYWDAQYAAHYDRAAPHVVDILPAAAPPTVATQAARTKVDEFASALNVEGSDALILAARGRTKNRPSPHPRPESAQRNRSR